MLVWLFVVLVTVEHECYHTEGGELLEVSTSFKVKRLIK